MKVLFFLSTLRFKTPPDAVIFTGSTLPNKVETGQLKRCTHIREAYFKPPQTPLSNYNPWAAKLAHGFYSDLEVWWQ